MATLLRRLSLNIDRSASARIGDEQPGSARAALPTLPSNTSFNDFSMHVGQEGKCRRRVGGVSEA